MEGHCNRKMKAWGRHVPPPPPWAQAYPHALAWCHSHQAALEEDVSLAHRFNFSVAGMDISEHTVPGDGLLRSRAAGRELVDAADADGTAGPIERGEIGAHGEGAETGGDPAVPGPGLDLAHAAERTAGRLARQAGARGAGTALGAVRAQQRGVRLCTEGGQGRVAWRVVTMATTLPPSRSMQVPLPQLP